MNDNNNNILNMVSVRLVKDPPLISKEPIDTAERAVMLLGETICQMDREVLFALNLNTKGMPINGTMISMGSLNQSIASPREIFKASILSNAASLILLHNHPSGNVNPSPEDIAITNRLIKAGAILGIRLNDHIIYGNKVDTMYSFKEKSAFQWVNPTQYLADLEDVDFNKHFSFSSKLEDIDFNQYTSSMKDKVLNEAANSYTTRISRQQQNKKITKAPSKAKGILPEF